MKKFFDYAIELFLLGMLFASILFYVKPGASVFYKRFQINPQDVVSETSNLAYQFDLDADLYNQNTLLLKEDDQFLQTSSLPEVKAGSNGTYYVRTEDDGSYTLLFRPISAKLDLANTHVYTIMVRYWIFSKDTGAIGVIGVILTVFLVSFLFIENRKQVFSSPIGIVRLWASGQAGRSIINFYKKITLRGFLEGFFIPLSLLWVYSGIYKYIVGRLFSIGINYNFTHNLWLYLSILLGFSLPLLLILIFRQTKSPSARKSTPSKFDPLSLILVLLPMTPVVQYLIINNDMLSMIETLKIIGFFLTFSGLLVVLLPLSLKRFATLSTTMTLGMSFAYTITNMAMITRQFAWYENGTFTIQVLFLAGAYTLARVFGRKLVYSYIILSFIGNSVVQIFRIEPLPGGDSLSAEENHLLQLVENHTPVLTPNIYFLIYDSYVPSEVMENYGIDNSAQETHLQELGFKIYPNIYTIGSTSINSISRVLNSANQFYGDRRRGVSGNGVVNSIFQDIGYLNLGHFTNTFFFTGTSSGYDITYPEGIANAYLTEGTLLGEFKNDLHYYDPPHEEYVAAKREIFRNPPAEPIFCYMHTNTPNHSINTGRCQGRPFELYESRLDSANQEMTDDLDVLLENDPQAIIIVAGDHGPYITKNCANLLTGHYEASEITRLDIQDRYGVFLAIRWPDNDFEQYDDITILQDLFPAIFAYLYQDPNILEAKVTPVSSDTNLSGIYLDHGIIRGGADDGQPLYLNAP